MEKSSCSMRTIPCVRRQNSSSPWSRRAMQTMSRPNGALGAHTESGPWPASSVTTNRSILLPTPFREARRHRSDPAAPIGRNGKTTARYRAGPAAPFDDALACGISTQLRHSVPGFDEFIQPSDDDFRQSGLKAPSIIRLGYVTVLMPDDVICRIGVISPTRLKRLLQRLGQHFTERASQIP